MAASSVSINGRPHRMQGLSQEWIFEMEGIRGKTKSSPRSNHMGQWKSGGWNRNL